MPGRQTSLAKSEIRAARCPEPTPPPQAVQYVMAMTLLAATISKLKALGVPEHVRDAALKSISEMYPKKK
jgi:replication-associated recombination protein RarA